MHPKNLSITDFTYELPVEKIAHFSLDQRDESRLLVYRQGQITESRYQQIANHIPENSFLVFNNTKVIEARLLFQKPTGGIVEIFCLEPDAQYADIATALQQEQKVLWKCLVGGASKWKPGQVLEKEIIYENARFLLQAVVVEKQANTFIIAFSWNGLLSFATILHFFGAIPLPPYIKRQVTESDNERYQTIFAKQQGSVAAPTAGLHFTDTIFTQLNKKNSSTNFVTLHVGAGTFMPVKAATMQAHEMHAEWIDVSSIFIENLLANLHQPVIAIGTTSLRTIESLYWLGVKLNRLETTTTPAISQWEAYENLDTHISAKESLLTLLSWMQKNNLQQIVTKTQIIIAPGYRPKIATGLVTNFHQPQSTLLLLVAALIGEDWRKVYEYAVENDFRFLSYGDGSLLWFH